MVSVGSAPIKADVNLTPFSSTFDERVEYLYWLQWNKVLQCKKENKVNLVVIYSWNEYHERSQIEPCNDATSIHANNPYFLLNKTKEYIERLKAC